MLNFKAVIQLFAVNREPARLNRPLVALFLCRLRQPSEPFHMVNRQADFAPIAEQDMQDIFFKAQAPCLHLSFCFACYQIYTTH